MPAPTMITRNGFVDLVSVCVMPAINFQNVVYCRVEDRLLFVELGVREGKFQEEVMERKFSCNVRYTSAVASRVEVLFTGANLIIR